MPSRPISDETADAGQASRLHQRTPMLKKTKQVRAQKTRDALIRSAIDVVRKSGFENTRIQDISDHAGVTPGAILYHFRNLETLLMEAFRADFDDLLRAVVQPNALSQLSNDEIVRATMEMLEDRAFQARIGVLTEFLIGARKDTKRKRLVENVMTANRDQVVERFSSGFGFAIDGERLWGIIDIVISLLVAKQLNYPSARKSGKPLELAKPFIEQELLRILEETRSR